MPARWTAIFVFCLVFGLRGIGAPSEPAPTHPRVGEEKGALVEVACLDTTLRLDIRYATSNNFMHRPMYTQARAWLRPAAAAALVRVHRSLRAKGLGLLIFDAYRPFRVTRAFWDSTTPAQHRFLADPAKGSIHNRGCAVDLTLMDLRTGAPLAMPSAYDEFSHRASPRYAGGSSRARANRDLLRAAMEREGFTVNKGEWWHFDHAGWKEYGILDIPFEALPAGCP